MSNQNNFTTATVQQQTVFPNNRPQFNRQRHQVVIFLGISEIVLGVLSLGIGVALLGILHGVGTSGTGVWGGIWFILAGSFGWAAGSKTTARCMINTHMVLSIIGSVVAAVQLVWAALLAVTFKVLDEVLDKSIWELEMGNQVFALFTTMSVISGISFIILIVSASYCCCALPSCCKSEPRQPAHVLVTQTNTQHYPGGQVVPVNYAGSGYPAPGYGPL